MSLCQFLKQSIVEPGFLKISVSFPMCFPSQNRFGLVRVILNLTDLNVHVSYILFKMDTLKDVIPLIFPNCFIFLLQLISRTSRPEDRKWLQFWWKGRAFWIYLSLSGVIFCSSHLYKVAETCSLPPSVPWDGCGLLF